VTQMSLPDTGRVPGHRQSAGSRAALVGSAAVYTATAMVDLIGRPDMNPPGHHLSGSAGYAFTAMLLPFAASTVAVAWWLRAHQPDGRPVRVAAWLVAAGAAGFWVCGIGSLATADSRFGGLLYPAAMLASLAGLSILAVAGVRAQALAFWAAPALPLAWIVGGPIGEGQFFRGAALILAAITATLAVALRPVTSCTTAASNPSSVRFG
jgi:hypothetical protein